LLAVALGTTKRAHARHRYTMHCQYMTSQNACSLLICVCLVLLSWLGVDDDAAQRAMSGGRRITETELPADVDGISCAVLDETVDIHLVRMYFTAGAWTALSAMKTAKMDNYTWLCGLCHHDLGDDTSVVCEACFAWYHLRCCGLKQCPKRRNWMCCVSYNS